MPLSPQLATTRRLRQVLIATTLLAGSGAHAAERLQPLSKTAQSITGPITFSPDRLVIGRRATLALVRASTGVSFDGGFGIGTVSADIYRILTPTDPVLIRGNHLCGGDKPLTFLVVWTGKGMSGPVTTLAPSTSPTAPATIADTCGTLSYVP